MILGEDPVTGDVDRAGQREHRLARLRDPARGAVAGRRMGGSTIWFTGLSGLGQVDVSSAVARRLSGAGVARTCSTATTSATG